MQITKIIETETGHRLTDYDGKCACIHGHRYRWEVTVSSDQLDAIGFVIDFGALKSILKNTVDDLDHAFLLHDQDPMVKEMGIQKVKYFMRASHGGDGHVFILPFNPTSENIVNWMAENIKQALPPGITLSRIKMWETSASYTVWENNG